MDGATATCPQAIETAEAPMELILARWAGFSFVRVGMPLKSAAELTDLKLLVNTTNPTL